MGDMIRDAALFAAPGVELTRRDDGSLILAPRMPLGDYVRCLGEYLEHWAREAPDRPFLLERGTGGQWQGVSYAQARQKVVRIASWLLENEMDAKRPVVILSDNSVEHALLMLACMHAGVTYSAISPAYSLMSKDHAKLKALIRRLEPGLLYVSDPARYSAALGAIGGLHDAPLVVSDGCSRLPAGALRFSSLLAAPDEAAVAQAFGAVGPDTVAKILFTSGSTSEPKGVLNTQRMLCSNQQAKQQLWPFLRQKPPVLLDWLPWNHTFGGNHNFNMVLANGGTLYIDSGKPMPGLFDVSIASLREVAPTLYLNVPRGFDMLVPALRADAQLRRQFFSRIQLIFYAAAALPQHLWDALIELSTQELGHAVPMVTAWGSTETAPLASDCNYQASRTGVIGLPIPGVSLKLVPTGEKLEVRVKGPNVTPGYFRQPELSVKAFDDEGFYLIGDAVRFVDRDNPELGLMFDGRVAEDFKLSSGTWVSVGAMRVKAIELMAPVAQDIVIAGHDRNDVGMLVFANLPACRKLAGLPADAPAAQVLSHPTVLARAREGMEQLREQGTGTSTYASRALLMAEPASVDAGEITDKGYINQAAVLMHRAALVERLYADPLDDGVILLH